MRGTWAEDDLQRRVDHAARGASPHQRQIKPQHPERFRADDIVRIGEDRLTGTGKFYYGREIMRALNEAVRVEIVNDDGWITVERAIGANPAQRVRPNDKLYIVGSATPSTTQG